jgi:hypothetical protein
VLAAALIAIAAFASPALAQSPPPASVVPTAPGVIEPGTASESGLALWAPVYPLGVVGLGVVTAVTALRLTGRPDDPADLTWCSVTPARSGTLAEVM